MFAGVMDFMYNWLRWWSPLQIFRIMGAIIKSAIELFTGDLG